MRERERESICVCVCRSVDRSACLSVCLSVCVCLNLCHHYCFCTCQGRSHGDDLRRHGDDLGPSQPSHHPPGSGHTGGCGARFGQEDPSQGISPRQRAPHLHELHGGQSRAVLADRVLDLPAAAYAGSPDPPQAAGGTLHFA